MSLQIYRIPGSKGLSSKVCECVARNNLYVSKSWDFAPDIIYNAMSGKE